MGETHGGEEQEVARTLAGARAGHAELRDELFRLVYDELRALAAASMQRQESGHTLQPTALVNEAYLRLIRGKEVDWVDRNHFFAVAAKCIRQILIDHARARNTRKRGDGIQHVTLTHGVLPGEEKQDVEILSLDLALERLESFDPRWARIVELRFFGGLTIEETAETLAVSKRTVQRDWRFARAWLYGQLNPEANA